MTTKQKSSTLSASFTSDPETDPSSKRPRGEATYAALPPITKLSKSKAALAKEALDELNLHSYYADPDTGQFLKREDRIKQLKLVLMELQKDADLPGLRHGNLCFVASDVAGRTTLDKAKLVELGVSIKILRQAEKQGDSYTKTTFARINL